MLIEDYFHGIEQAITQSPVITDTQLVMDKRSLYIGFVEGTLTLLDGSTLHFMEFVNVKVAVNRYKYTYHYQDAVETLVFRYDMAPHINMSALFLIINISPMDRLLMLLHRLFLMY